MAQLLQFFIEYAEVMVPADGVSTLGSRTVSTTLVGGSNPLQLVHAGNVEQPA